MAALCKRQADYSWLTFCLTGVLETRVIVCEITGQQYRKLYSYREYLDVLNEDTL